MSRSRDPATAFLYLASQSPRRSELLSQLGVPHRLLLPRDDEDAEALEAERPGELPAAYVERVTRAKLDAAQARLRSSGLDAAPILCADTTVALGRRIFGKPADAADVRRMLNALSGRTHRAITAVAVAVAPLAPIAPMAPIAPRAPVGSVRVASGGRSAAAPGRALFAISTSHVHFAPLASDDIERYIASGEPFGKAGAYAIQGAAGAWITRIDGSYTGIMGLPLHETATLLWQAGLAWPAELPAPAPGD